MGNILRELRRRNVFRVAAAYLVVGWLVLQVAGVLENSAGLPFWTDGVALVILMTGFPVVLFVAWAFELTPDGLKRTADVPEDESIAGQTGRTLDYAIGAMLILVIGLIAWQLISMQPRGGNADPPALAAVNTANAGEGSDRTEVADLAPASAPFEPDAKSVAVIPFLSFSSDEEVGFFADGLTEEILNSLASIPDLTITSRTSSFQFRGENIPSIPEIASRLGVAHILEGSVRRAGDQVRVTAQPIRAQDDAHLWSQTYDRPMADVFAIQEDIAENVARVLEVVLDDAARERMQHSGARNIEAYIAYQRGRQLYEDIHIREEYEALFEANTHFEEATQLDPGFSEAYLLQSDAYAHQMVELSRGAEFDEQAFEAAHAEHERLLTEAENASRDPVRRAIARGNRLLFSDDWTNARDVLAIVLDGNTCAAENYLRTLANYLPPSPEILDYYRAQVRCDPLSPTSWTALANAARDTGNFYEALEALRRDAELSGTIFREELITVEERLSAGDPDGAEAILNAEERSAVDRAFFELRIASMRGDAAAANDAAEVLLAIPQIPLHFRVMVEALRGNREEANALMAQLDQRPLTAVQVGDMLTFCSCGSPFDREAAPNFIARIEEAGFPWPPTPDYGFALMRE